MADVNMNANFDNYTSFTAKFGIVMNSIVVDPEVTETSGNPVASSGIYKFVEEEIQKGGKVKDVIVEDESIVDEEGIAIIPLADEETKGLVGEGYGFEVKNGYPQAGVYSKTIFNQLKDFLFISKGTLLNVLSGFQTLLESGKNIKTINKKSILGEGDFEVHEGMVDDVKVNGVSAVEDKIANVTVPTKTSDITNDSDFVTSKDIPAPYDDTEIREEISGLDDKIKELELFKFPNVTIIGTPIINNGQISNFSATSYLKFPFLVDFRNQPFEINMAFTTGANVVSQENIFDSDFGLAFAVRNSRFVIAISTNGTSWDLGEGVGTLTVQPNTTYYIRLSWSGSQYILYYSFDGVSFTPDITKAGTAQPYPKQIYIGVGENFASVVNHFSGTINLNNANVKVNGEIFWTGMDDAGISTRADVSLSNLDADGEEKIKEVAETEAIKADLIELDTEVDTKIPDQYPGSQKPTGNSKGYYLDNKVFVGDCDNNIPNAFTNIRRLPEGSSVVTGTILNGATFGVGADGTASFFHKTFDLTSTKGKQVGGRNNAVLRFYATRNGEDSEGKLQFAINKTTSSTPPESAYKNVAMVDDLNELPKDVQVDGISVLGEDKIARIPRASSNTSGTIKIGNGAQLTSAGTIRATALTKPNYDAANGNTFVGKATLENVLNPIREEINTVEDRFNNLISPQIFCVNFGVSGNAVINYDGKDIILKANGGWTNITYGIFFRAGTYRVSLDSIDGAVGNLEISNYRFGEMPTTGKVIVDKDNLSVDFTYDHDAWGGFSLTNSYGAVGNIEFKNAKIVKIA